MVEALITLTHVAKSYGARAIIASATISVNAGEVLCLTGPSGIGKSTLLELIAGVTKPDIGIITSATPPALMFQDDALIPWLNAEETVRYILPRTLSEKEQKERALFWLARFGLHATQYPAAMSGGMRRRLSLARTFAARRALVLLDEPFAFLDEKNQRIVAEETAAHVKTGGSAVLTSHTLEPLNMPCFSGVPCRSIRLERAPVVVCA